MPCPDSPEFGRVPALLTRVDAVIARKEPHRHPPVAARWLLRYLEERDEVTIEEAGVATACLQALDTTMHDEAAQTLSGGGRRNPPLVPRKLVRKASREATVGNRDLFTG